METEEDIARVWVEDRGWRLLPAGTPKLCRYYRCRRRAVAELLRGSKGRWWAYCKDHLFGRQIRNGRVEWEVYPDSLAAQRGYTPT